MGKETGVKIRKNFSKKACLTLTVILLAVQSVLMLLEPPLWLVWQIALFGAVAALNSREMLLSVKKLLHRA